jgi:hypothetical protein
MKLNFPSFKEYVMINENKLVDDLHDRIKNTLSDSLVDMKLYRDYSVSRLEIDKILEQATIKIMDKIA